MSRAHITNVDYYDCSAKPDGNYLHPTDCTRYIVCANGTAHDMACPDCGKDNHPQCNGQEFLVYEDTQFDWCDWPSNIPCGANERPELACYDDS